MHEQSPSRIHVLPQLVPKPTACNLCASCGSVAESRMATCTQARACACSTCARPSHSRMRRAPSHMCGCCCRCCSAAARTRSPVRASVARCARHAHARLLARTLQVRRACDARLARCALAKITCARRYHTRVNCAGRRNCNSRSLECTGNGCCNARQKNRAGQRRSAYNTHCPARARRRGATSRRRLPVDGEQRCVG